MTRQDVTFFGEVGAISSRALWTDSEDDDVESGKKWSHTVSAGFSFAKFDVVFVSRSNVQNDSRLELVSSVEVQEEEEGVMSKKLKLVDLYEMKNESRSAWLMINPRTCGKMGDGCVGVLREVVQEKLKGTTGTVVIVVVSSDGSEDIRYLQNEHLPANHPMFLSLKNVMAKKVLPPTIISHPSEAATFELCTVMSIASCIFLVPDSNRSNFDIEPLNVPDSLKMVIKSLPGSQTLSDSNMYT